jgi:hypothetical protein
MGNAKWTRVDQQLPPLVTTVVVWLVEDDGSAGSVAAHYWNERWWLNWVCEIDDGAVATHWTHLPQMDEGGE